ncbi:hypothetical protein [Desulfobacterium sp. N47]
MGYNTCLKGNTVLFGTAIDIINTLSRPLRLLGT